MWYRLVGVDLSSQGNLTADAESSVRFVAGQLNMELAFGSFVQVVAPNTSVTAGAVRPVNAHLCCELSPCNWKSGTERVAFDVILHTLLARDSALDGLLSGRAVVKIPRMTFSICDKKSGRCCCAQLLGSGSSSKRRRHRRPADSSTTTTHTWRWT